MARHIQPLYPSVPVFRKLMEMIRDEEYASSDRITTEAVQFCERMATYGYTEKQIFTMLVSTYGVARANEFFVAWQKISEDQYDAANILFPLMRPPKPDEPAWVPRMSESLVSGLSACPMRHWIEPRCQKSPVIYLIFGRAVHRTLETMNGYVLDGKPIDMAEFEVMFLSDFQKQLRLDDPASSLDPNVVQSYIEGGHRLLCLYREKVIPYISFSEQAEKKFLVSVSGKNIRYHGFIPGKFIQQFIPTTVLYPKEIVISVNDFELAGRTDARGFWPDPVTGKLVPTIFDLKTTLHYWKPNREHKSTQASMYLLADKLSDRPDHEKAQQVVFLILVFDAETGELGFDVRITSRTDEELRIFYQSIRSVWIDFLVMRASERYLANPTPLCDYCVARDDCGPGMRFLNYRGQFRGNFSAEQRSK